MRDNEREREEDRMARRSNELCVVGKMHCILVHLLQQLGAYTKRCMLVAFFLAVSNIFPLQFMYTRLVLSLIRSAAFVLSLFALSSALHIFIRIGLTFHANACLLILSFKFSTFSSWGFAHCWCNVPMKISTKLKKKNGKNINNNNSVNHFTHCAMKNKTMRAHEKFHER